MKKINLKVDKRTAFGKKVKNLRKEGTLPATIYGKDVKSLSVQVPLKEFESVYKEAGETGLIELSLDSQSPRHVLIKNVQLDPKTSASIHVDFLQVKLTEKIKAMVPVEPVGEAKAVLDKIGLLEVPLSQIEVEALPTDLPEKIEVDVAGLVSIGDQITVGGVKAPSGVSILTDADQILFKIGELVTKEAEELAKAEEAAKAAAAAQAGAEAGAAPAAEGEATAPAGEKPAEAPAGEPKEAPKETPKTEGKPK